MMKKKTNRVMIELLRKKDCELVVKGEEEEKVYHNAGLLTHHHRIH